MGGTWSIHCLHYDCEKWANPCRFTKGEVAENCTNPKKRIGLTEIPV